MLDFDTFFTGEKSYHHKANYQSWMHTTPVSDEMEKIRYAMPSLAAELEGMPRKPNDTLALLMRDIVSSHARCCLYSPHLPQYQSWQLQSPISPRRASAPPRWRSRSGRSRRGPSRPAPGSAPPRAAAGPSLSPVRRRSSRCRRPVVSLTPQPNRLGQPPPQPTPPPPVPPVPLHPLQRPVLLQPELSSRCCTIPSEPAPVSNRPASAVRCRA